MWGDASSCRTSHLPRTKQQLGFKQPNPFTICEARAFPSQHWTVRTRACAQISQHIKNVWCAHHAQADGSTVMAYPVWRSHICTSRGLGAVTVHCGRGVPRALLTLTNRYGLVPRSWGQQFNTHSRPSSPGSSAGRSFTPRAQNPRTSTTGYRESESETVTFLQCFPVSGEN